jgi:hypothetical protein
MNVAAAAMLFVVAWGAVIFTFVAALVWVGARRKEREAFYLSEMVKNIAASSTSSATDLLREHERAKNRRSREGLTIGGLIGSLAAVGLMVSLHGILSQVAPVYLVGLIPLLPSAGILVYARLFAPHD